MNPSETLLRQVAANLRAARQGRGWSQQALADRAEVSLRMVAALEAGNSNVSLATLDRLAHALGSTFAELIRAPSSRSGQTEPVLVWQGASPHSRACLLQSVPAGGTLELWDWSLGPGERYDAEADRPGVREMVYLRDQRHAHAGAGRRGGDRRRRPVHRLPLRPRVRVRERRRLARPLRPQHDRLIPPKKPHARMRRRGEKGRARPGGSGSSPTAQLSDATPSSAAPGFIDRGALPQHTNSAFVQYQTELGHPCSG
jgi:transcriptional regulator with XRE-family HTH domain